MGYLVLARKWRPQSFDEIIGQEHVSRTLMNAIRSDRVAHAFLFTGVRGVGKTTAARVLAKALNCVNGPTPTPCNTCINCQEITAGNAVDVLEIDGASNTGVDDVREIIENVRYQPAKSRFKIYIIDEVHMLSTSAFNALLKTLEEPPPHVKFIFATTDPHKVPHTIHSRCQRYDFKRMPFRLIADRLAHIARSEGIDISARALFLIAREGEGSMRDAQSLFDQVIAFAGKVITDEDVVTALGVADRKLLYTLAGALVDRNPGRALELLNELHLYGYDLRRFVRELLEHFRNLSVARLLGATDILSDLPDEERTEVSRQAERMSTEDLDRAFRLLLDAETEVSRVPYPKLVLDMALIKVATLTPVVPIGEMLDRIAELEHHLNGRSESARPATSPAADKPAASARREPVAPAKSEVSRTRTGASAAATPPLPPGERSWATFLDFVAKEKVTLLPYLKSSEPPTLDGPVLALAVPRGYFHDYLVQRDHTQLLEELAARFFERPLRVIVKPAEAVEAASAPTTVENPAVLHAEALGDPVVRAAVEILGGEVQEVKSRARRGKGTT
jgi:DNA polymerase III subunit gamma/tau